MHPDAATRAVMDFQELDSWQCPLAENEVHLWSSSLEVGDAFLGRAEGFLAAQELEKAGRFHFRKDREHYLAARGLLRTILGRYLQRDPSELCFRYNKHGKPFLSALAKDAEISFNLTHSHGYLLLAISRGRTVGIDLEKVQQGGADNLVNETIFTGKEIDLLATLSPSARLMAFFLCWTLKEAVVKGMGTGLSFPVNQIDVARMIDRDVDALCLDNDSAIPLWTLLKLRPFVGYAGALAVEGGVPKVSHWHIETYSF